MTFYEALTNYVDAHYKPLNPEFHSPDDDDWVCDHKKWQGESAWILETEFPCELDQFIQDLINEFTLNKNKQIWILNERD